MKRSRRIYIWIAAISAIGFLGAAPGYAQSKTGAPTVTVYQDPG